jgi:hypothetical protein
MEKSLNRFCLLWQCTLYKHTYTWWMVQSKTNNNFLYILLIFWLTVKKHLVTEEIETIVMYSLTDHFFDTLIFHVLVLIFCVTKRRSTLECESGDDKIGGHTYFFLSFSLLFFLLLLLSWNTDYQPSRSFAFQMRCIIDSIECLWSAFLNIER